MRLFALQRRERRLRQGVRKLPLKLVAYDDQAARRVPGTGRAPPGARGLSGGQHKMLPWHSQATPCFW